MFKDYRRVGYRLLMFAAAMMSLLLVSCVKNELKVSLELPKDITDAYRLLYYASDSKKGWYTETVVTVQQGKGETLCYTKNPTIVYVMYSGNMPEAAFYAERGGKIRITGETGDPYAWKIEGNKINEEWSEWRIANKEALKGRDSQKINKAVAGFVNANSDKALSAILLLTYYDRRSDDKGFRVLWNKLKGDALKPEWVQLAGCADMPGGMPAERLKVGELILHTAGNGADTLKIGGKPMILYFWRSDDSDKAESMNELRNLRKLVPDSSRYLISDISFEMDSLSWRYGLSGDSLKGVVRGWLPIGEADSVVMRMGVNRTPYVLVYDKKGQEVYRGDDLSKASAMYRKLTAPER